MSSDSDEYADAIEPEKDFPEQNSNFSEDGDISGIVDDDFEDNSETVDENSSEPSQHPFTKENKSDKSSPLKAEPDELELRRIEESKLSVEELESRKCTAIKLKDSGNDLFKSSVYEEALTKYTEALDVCPLIYKVERSILFANRAACSVKLEHVEDALRDCDRSLELQPDYVKCLLRRASLYEQQDSLTNALEDYQKLVQLDPGNEKARWACMTLPDRIKIQQEKMKEEMMGQLKQLGNMILKPFGLSTDNFKVQQDPNSGQYSINFSR